MQLEAFSSPENTPIPQPPSRPLGKRWRFLIVIFLVGGIVIGSSFFVLQPPRDFVPGTTVSIPSGTTTQGAGALLEEHHIIRSSSFFQFVVSMFLNNRSIIAGEFNFEQRYSTFRVAQIVTSTALGNKQVRIMIPEGSTLREIATIIQKNIPTFNSDEFIAKSSPAEGYLFPETYLFRRQTTPDEVIQKMKQEYTKRTQKLMSTPSTLKISEKDTVIMASLLEKEARNDAEARVIAGILWKRIRKNIPLQVDAPFLYVLNKSSAQLTLKDLQKDGPYNTYTRKGLPQGPIGNPGMGMLTAAREPEETAYWYYLHDAQGVIHYATTYEQHLMNKKKYLP